MEVDDGTHCTEIDNQDRFGEVDILKPDNDVKFRNHEFPISNLYGARILTSTLMVWFIVVALITLSYEPTVIRSLLSLLILGWASYRIQFVLHDASHATLFSSRKLNDLVGQLAGLLVGVNFHQYRKTHMKHHRHNGTELDPQFHDLMRRDLPRLRRGWFLLSPVIGWRLIPYIRREFHSSFVTRSGGSREVSGQLGMLVICQLGIASLMIFLSGDWELPIIFYLSLATVALFLARLRAVAEHQTFDKNSPIDFTRTHSFNWLDFMLLYDANFNYHAEHHLYPALQSRHLKTVSALLSQSVRSKNLKSRSMFKSIGRLVRE